MPEIGTSGSMSGDRKRSDAARPKLPRLSSTLPLALPAMLGMFGSLRGPQDLTGTCGLGYGREMGLDLAVNTKRNCIGKEYDFVSGMIRRSRLRPRSRCLFLQRGGAYGWNRVTTHRARPPRPVRAGLIRAPPTGHSGASADCADSDYRGQQSD